MSAQTTSVPGNGLKIVQFSLDEITENTRIGLAGAAGTILLTPMSIPSGGLSKEEKVALGVGVGFAVCVLLVFIAFFCAE